MSVCRYPLFILMFAVLPSLVRADINSELFSSYQRLLADYQIEKILAGEGLVSAFDYEAALADGDLEQRLARQTKALASFDPETLNGRKESLAFWINAYNFFMVRQILTEQPDGVLVSSVWDYGGRVNPFVENVFERANFEIGGSSYSLNDIEKGILLGDDFADRGWKDARIHFAVNCASVGCPPLRNVVYTADNLETILAENTRRAFNTERHLRIDGDVLFVTALFDWYQEDFLAASGSVKAFIEAWADPAVAVRVRDAETLEYIDYDWRLNSPGNLKLN
ncbi:DUF547 domain-containing protein [Marinobacter sp. F3R08]|uniref:DUF547 domain-containing protein n=1 Tax=Marinobacter sp. F3R08 TaxID=2841559 RepID=UPI001C084B5E|nr:DUF547 domain-containing protein [Marinobacter sp. F3R08]MBU2952803.1 DUF547 domain-containing protein [Marinobacter sp. F3R08]